MKFSLKIPIDEEKEQAYKLWENIDLKSISKEQINNYIEGLKIQLITLYKTFPRLHNYSNRLLG